MTTVPFVLVRDVRTHSRARCQELASHVHNLNIFPSVPPKTDAYDLRTQRIATRIFIGLLVLATTVLIGYISLINVTKTITVNKPTLTQYSALYAKHAQSLACGCSQVSIDYGQVAAVHYRMHQVCSSVFINDSWLESFRSSFDPESLQPIDFRVAGMHIFQAVRTFCQMSDRAIADHLISFYSNQYVSSMVTPEKLFRSQTEGAFKQFVSSTTNDLLSSLKTIRDVTYANALFSARLTNYIAFFQWQPSAFAVSLAPSNCSCAISQSCVEPSVIFQYPEEKLLFAVPGIFQGCFMIEAALQSTLECFYSPDCIRQLQYYLASNTSIVFPALSATQPSRYRANSTMKTLLDELMVEEWNLTSTYESYYRACQPTQCTYTSVLKNEAIYIVTTLFGLIGGLVTILKVTVPITVKFGRKLKKSSRSKSGRMLQRQDNSKRGDRLVLRSS